MNLNPITSGSYPYLYLRATDSGGLYCEYSYSIEVELNNSCEFTPGPYSYIVTVEVSSTISLPYASDSDGDNLSYSIEYGEERSSSPYSFVTATYFYLTTNSM